MNESIKRLYGKSVKEADKAKLEIFFNQLSDEEQSTFNLLIDYNNRFKRNIISKTAIRIMLDMHDEFNINIFPVITRLAKKGQNSKTGEHVIFEMNTLNGNVDVMSYIPHFHGSKVNFYLTTKMYFKCRKEDNVIIEKSNKDIDIWEN